jgi:hypothetical protein
MQTNKKYKNHYKHKRKFLDMDRDGGVGIYEDQKRGST